MTALSAAFAVEVVAGARHVAQGRVAAWMRVQDQYEERRPMQLLLIALVIALIMIATTITIRNTRPVDCALRTSAIGLLAVLASFLVETVSLHAVDAYLYRPAGPLLLVGWWWLAAGVAIVATALRS